MVKNAKLARPKKRPNFAADGYMGGQYVLPVPRLSYSDEFDPPDSMRMAKIRRATMKGKKRSYRTLQIPLVEIRFPGSRLRDGKAPGPVLGLTKAQVQWVLDQKFAVPFKDIPTIQYLFQLARSLAGNPLFDDFDTAVRDALHSVEHEAVYRGFWLLSDYLHNPKREHDDARDDGWLWSHLATYLFWAECTSVGSGLPFYFARLHKLEENERAPKKLREIVKGIQDRGWNRLLGPVSKKAKPKK